MPDACVELSPASDYTQRWNAGRHTFRHHADGRMNPAAYAVEPIDEATAKHYVVANHYSSSYPAASQRYGLFRAGQLVGVCVLGIPVQTKVLTSTFPDLVPFTQSLELSRLVLHDGPGNEESWFIARVFEAAAATGVRGIVSFSDPVPRRVGNRVLFPGHIGTIYQASNGVFTGRATARTLTLLSDGTVLNDRSIQKVRKQERGHEHVERSLVAMGARPLRAGQKPAEWLAEAITDVGARKLRHRGNYRYAFAIGTPAQRRRVRISGERQSYPKERDAA